MSKCPGYGSPEWWASVIHMTPEYLETVALSLADRGAKDAAARVERIAKYKRSRAIVQPAPALVDTREDNPLTHDELQRMWALEAANAAGMVELAEAIEVGNWPVRQPAEVTK